MRKNLYLGLIACAALTMTGCSNDEISYDSSKQEAQPIQFSTYLGKNVQGRGTVSTSTTIQSDNIGVTAFYTGQTLWSALTPAKAPDFMYNQKVTYSTNWTYDPVKYWPTKANDKISFFAYAPYSDNANISTSGKSDPGTPTVTVTYPTTDLTKMVDFVAASVIDQTKTATVSFDLKHEMTRVDIKAKVNENVYQGTDHDATKVVIRSIKLNAVGSDGNFYNGGTYTFSNDGSTGTWAGVTTDPNLDLATILATTTQSLGGYGESGIALEGTTPTSLFTTDEYLFLVPATAQSGDGLIDGKATATIEYDIVTIDSKLNAGHSVTSATKTINLPTGTLKQGTAYTYTFTIKVAGVELSATVADWTTPENGSETVDYGSADN